MYKKMFSSLVKREIKKENNIVYIFDLLDWQSIYKIENIQHWRESGHSQTFHGSITCIAFLEGKLARTFTHNVIYR